LAKKTLLIVESSTKANTIKRFLGSGYQVLASNGHLIDLPKSKLGIDIEKDFKPTYITIRGRGEILNKLKSAGKKVDRVLLAADPDREGEAICWHLSRALGLDDRDLIRIEFNEITGAAIKKALKEPKLIDENRVEAQQARRILDRLVGYQISPLLWQKVRKGLSAGRVQSVAVALICDREKEIEAFVADEYWSVEAVLTGQSRQPFSAQLLKAKGKKIKIGNRETADRIVKELEGSSFVVEKVTAKKVNRRPAPPFITSSLQQVAAQKLGFNTRKTMQLAQQLYEGIKLGDGRATGLVTYIRTDSTRISNEACKRVREYIGEKLGPQYLPPTPHAFKSPRRAQEAHEAIRPSDVYREPEQVKAFLNRDQWRLYKLIWSRFVASQVAAAVVDTLKVDIIGGDYSLRATGIRVVFDGHLSVYRKDEKDSKADNWLPPLAEGEELKLKSLLPEQHFTAPPPRYNEASLVRTLEVKGIGRPSTYSPIIETIRSRGYVSLEKKVFKPTELGTIIVDLLKEFFPEIIDVEFTARLEDKLDDIEEGKLNSIQVLEEFYGPFSNRLKVAGEQMQKVEMEPEYSGQQCPQCEKPLVYRTGRFGRFLACSGFPECRYTRNIKTELGVKCPACGGEMLEKRTRKGRIFYGCSNYPKCTFSLWKKPLPEKCPDCGYFMIEKDRNRKIIACGNPECPEKAARENKL
jgi:DNA topoisomerase-1